MERARELTLILLLILVGFFSVPVMAQQNKPKIVVLANSIDYELASDFFEFLRNRGIEVIHSTAADFDQYKQEKFIVILGGHEAYEGVGDIVKEILTPQEMKYIGIKGNRNMYTKTNVWNQGQVVKVIAGSDRYQTKKSHEENRDNVSSAAVEAYKPTWTPAPPTTQPPSVSGNVIIYDVLYDPPGQEPDNERITLKNQGSNTVDIRGWILTDGEGSYTIPTGTTIPAGALWSVYGYTYNPTRNTRGLYLNNNHDSVTLIDSEGNIIDEVSW